jgi:hypothetical protein
MSYTLLIAAISIGLLAGIYPALVLSSFNPIIVLKGRFATGSKGNLAQKRFGSSTIHYFDSAYHRNNCGLPANELYAKPGSWI